MDPLAGSPAQEELLGTCGLELGAAHRGTQEGEMQPESAWGLALEQPESRENTPRRRASQSPRPHHRSFTSRCWGRWESAERAPDPASISKVVADEEEKGEVLP